MGDRNREVVERYRVACSSREPAGYQQLLADDPVHHEGTTVRRGRAAFDRISAAEDARYPFGVRRSAVRRVVAEGDWVAELVDREAVTNADAFSENVHATFSEVRGGRIATQVELLDFRVASAKVDERALGAPTDPGVRAMPSAVAARPAPDDDSPSARAVRVVLEFLDAYLAFESDGFVDRLVADPIHQVGTTRRSGRDAYRAMAAAGRVLYPDGIADRTHHVLVSDGATVATLMSLRARTHLGVDYENLYGIFCDVHDGRVASLIEVYDSRVADAAFDLSVLAGRREQEEGA